MGVYHLRQQGPRVLTAFFWFIVSLQASDTIDDILNSNKGQEKPDNPRNDFHTKSADELSQLVSPVQKQINNNKYNNGAHREYGNG